MKIDHIGIATKDLANSIKEYENLGFSKDSDLIFDEYRNINIQFMKNESYRIELIEVAEKDVKSPIDNIMAKTEHSLMYHICYIVDNLLNKIEILKKKKYVLLTKEHDAIAFENRKVCFLYNKNIGIIELVEEKNN